MLGYENRPAPQNLHCKGWVEQNGNSITCRVDTDMAGNGSTGNCAMEALGVCYPSGQTINDTVINCSTKVGDQGWVGPDTAGCPFGKTLQYYAEYGHAEHTNSSAGNPPDQTCITKVEQQGNGIKCTATATNMLGCGNAGVGVCW